MSVKTINKKSHKKPVFDFSFDDLTISSDEDISNRMCNYSPEMIELKILEANDLYEIDCFENEKKALEGNFSDFYSYFYRKSLWNMLKEIRRYKKYLKEHINELDKNLNKAKK